MLVPAPVLGPLRPPLDEPVLLVPALDLAELVVQRAAPGRLALGAEVLLGLVQERRLSEGVVGAVAHVLHQIQALPDLPLGIPVGPLQVVRLGERVLPRVDLVDLAGPIPGDVAGRGVQEAERLVLGRQILRQGDEVLHAEGVDVQRVVQRRVEVDHASGVDEGVQGAPQLVADCLGDPGVLLGHVSGDGRDLLAEEGLERRAGVGLADGVEDRRGGHLGPEALLRGLPDAAVLPRALADDEVDVLHVREVVEDHRQPDLAQEARAAHDEQAPALEQAVDVERGGGGGVRGGVLHVGQPSSAGGASTSTSASISGQMRKQVMDGAVGAVSRAIRSASLMVLAVS